MISLIEDEQKEKKTKGVWGKAALGVGGTAAAAGAGYWAYKKLKSGDTDGVKKAGKGLIKKMANKTDDVSLPTNTPLPRINTK